MLLGMLKRCLDQQLLNSHNLSIWLLTLLTHRINPDRLLHIILPPYFLFLEPFVQHLFAILTDGIMRLSRFHQEKLTLIILCCDCGLRSSHLHCVHGRDWLEILFDKISKSGWPSGLRRQTQELFSSLLWSEHSGPRMRAWVRIPLLTQTFYLHWKNI